MSNPTDFSNFFKSMKDRAKLPGASIVPRLPLGKHRVAIKKYSGRNSQQGVVLTSEFIVLQTNNPALSVGETREWAWFPNGAGDRFGNESGRAIQFQQFVGACVGDTRAAEDIGDTLVAGNYAGVMLDVLVTQLMDRSGAPKKSKAGHDIFNADWAVIPGQTAESVMAARALIKQYEDNPPAPIVAMAAPAAVASSAPTTAAAAPFAVPTAAPVTSAPSAPAAAAPFAVPTAPAAAPVAPSAPIPAPAPSAPAAQGGPLAALFANLPK